MLATTTRARIAAPAELEVKREGIRFFNVTPKCVRIEIMVRNGGEARSERTPLHIESAPLGAFLPWRPLTTLSVPALEPGDETVVATEVERTPVGPLGAFGRVPPQQLLTALGADDDDDERAQLGGPMTPRQAMTLLRRRRRGLALDLFEALGRPGLHWAGNLNVFVGRRPVERHRAQALRIYPGRTNLAVFCVGRKPDAYAFELDGAGLAEHATLLAGCSAEIPILPAESGEVIGEHEWIEARRRLYITLSICPPPTCDCGALNVHVRQRSTGHEAVVEFELDSQAAGPGCFVV